MTLKASITIILQRVDHTAPHEVIAVEYRRAAIHHRIRFSDSSAPEDVFHAPLAQCLMRAISNLDGDTTIYTEPDLIVPLDGIALGRLRSISNTRRDGSQQLVIRFQNVVGCFQAAFLDEFGLQPAELSPQEEIETKLLSDIARPMLDVLHVIETPVLPEGAREALDSLLHRLRRDRDEIGFYIELLKRHVQSSERRKRPAPLGLRHRTDLPNAVSAPYPRLLNSAG